MGKRDFFINNDTIWIEGFAREVREQILQWKSSTICNVAVISKVWAGREGTSCYLFSLITVIICTYKQIGMHQLHSHHFSRDARKNMIFSNETSASLMKTL